MSGGGGQVVVGVVVRTVVAVAVAAKVTVALAMAVARVDMLAFASYSVVAPTAHLEIESRPNTQGASFTDA